MRRIATLSVVAAGAFAATAGVTLVNVPAYDSPCLLTERSLVMGDETGRWKPLLPGFHPDPSICRVGSSYYLVTSSFTWHPGLPIYRSENLLDWTLVGHAASGDEWAKLLDSRDGHYGLWAPTIRHINGKFHIVCTLQGWDDVKKSRFYPGHFLVSAEDPAGEWSSPKWIRGVGGIDPSLFQDTDGKVYLLANSAPSKRYVKDQNRIGVWEFDLERACVLDKGTPLVYGLHTRSRWTEAPHLYRMKNGQYLLLVAEGGTGPGHAVTTFLSDDVRGPYTPCENNPALTRRDSPDAPIQCTGHADLVETPTGEMYGVFLAVRNTFGKGTNPFGRETFMCPVRFDAEKQGLFFDDDELISGSVTEPRELVYTTKASPGMRLRRVLSANERQERTVTVGAHGKAAGLVIERSDKSMLRLLKRPGKIVVELTHREKMDVLASVPYEEADVFLRLQVDEGVIRCYCGPSPETCRQLGGAWPWGFLDGVYFIGAGIGECDETAEAAQ